ncbi:zinc finger MYM-type protein 1-like [Aphis craccivora]|uniref:Zinc finger MYM-type protein 1-like n=1 Tax=Aphis craccivora TaxID=307492 RepID=A0A6G0YEX4_APHCR|nr:zinc finger MYM-type protein 1-like [Aphis craccivora]
MKGLYKGAQAIILRANNEAIYSACTSHSLNLCGEQAAESCTAAITFFGAIQKLYNIFSSSTQRWEILKKKIPSSLHSMSRTRWSARVDSVKPVAAHLSAILETLEDLKLLNLTSECRRDIQGLEYGTLDVASKKLSSLIEDLHKIRNEEDLKRTRKRKRHIDEDDENENADDHQRTKFKNDVFNIILDSVIRDMTTRFKKKTTRLVKQYPKDLGYELTDELQSLKLIYSANFGEKTLSPWNILNAIKTSNLENLFLNLTVALRIFITIPATVASAERSFSVLKRVTNVLRSMCQNRLSSLGVLAVEKEIAKNTNLDAVIDGFAMIKAKKGTF